MSIRIMSWVWEHGPKKSTDRYVLLALADNADDNGKCWPSISHLSKKCSLSERTVIRAIKNLIKEGYLEKTRQQYTSNKYRILVSDNMAQTKVTESHKRGDRESLKPSKETSKEPEYSLPEELNTPEFEAVWNEWIAYRKEIKKKMTTRTINMQFKKLSGYPVGTAIAMIEQSIANGWQGIFELKEKRNNGEVKKDGSGMYV